HPDPTRRSSHTKPDPRPGAVLRPVLPYLPRNSPVPGSSSKRYSPARILCPYSYPFLLCKSRTCKNRRGIVKFIRLRVNPLPYRPVHLYLAKSGRGQKLLIPHRPRLLSRPQLFLKCLIFLHQTRGNALVRMIRRQGLGLLFPAVIR